MKAIISGGGSGGHIFPAIAIANAIRQRHPDADILFIGAEGKMEMEKVPAAGYPIKGLPIDGLHRQLNWTNIKRNIKLPYKILKSNRMVKSIITEFQPDIVIGVGGYASEPTLKTAGRMGFPTLIQEQNSYAGLTNKMLSKQAQKICVAYEGMERFFPAEKIVMTGNPVRQDIENMTATREEGCTYFHLNPERQTVLSVGGSLGARSINTMLLNHIEEFEKNNLQLVWQTGRWMYEQVSEAVRKAGAEEWVKVHQFINRMDLAYAAADIVISRAGAIAISELCLIGKPIILIPSPNVAEDHQTKNAQALVNKGAAILVKDSECNEQGIHKLLELSNSKELQAKMSTSCLAMGKRQAAQKIADEIDRIVQKS
ncbi:MAG: undecaprenyldiphospho-muramoylpentapeptide beta-N-acetylglucosaminyltransferase [Bacteroidales bacterium]|nr:undecaprenyldiphospho-muramoylpentapeptide beta-N-acetylglucosaminyltransferase [Bacteroidales bacterium]